LKYQFTTQAYKQLEKLEVEIQKRIILKIKFFTSQPYPLSYAETLCNSPYGTHRFRIGSYRVIFVVESDIINIIRIRKRESVYK
jgi:mRNA-degrading endonuclease RelE of RelBE toxin-antitoxin system